MREFRVEGFMPSSAAAPSLPATRQEGFQSPQNVFSFYLLKLTKLQDPLGHFLGQRLLHFDVANPIASGIR